MKKIIAMLMACLMVVGVLAACGETETPAGTTAGTNEPTDITLTVWGPRLSWARTTVAGCPSGAKSSTRLTPSGTSPLSTKSAAKATQAPM